MKITVLVAIYNGEKYLLQQLDSLIKQTREADEVIITDDCSNDKSYSIVKSFIKKNNLQWKLFENNKNVGYIENFKKMMEKSTGDIVLFCDQDDIWNENKLDEIEKIFEGNSKTKVVSSTLAFINSVGEKIEKEYIPYNLQDVLKKELVYIDTFKIIEKNFFPGCTMACRREIVNKYIECYNPEIPHDWAIAILGALDDGLYWYNNVLTFYRIHDNNTAGLATAKLDIYHYFFYTLTNWSDYLKKLKIRTDFVYNIQLINGKSKQYEWIKEFNNLRAMNCEKKSLRIFGKEVYYYLKYFIGKVDSRGLILDFFIMMGLDKLSAKEKVK